MAYGLNRNYTAAWELNSGSRELILILKSRPDPYSGIIATESSLS